MAPAWRSFRQCAISDTIPDTFDLHAGRDPVRMHAYVYKSQRKQDTFVYLARRDDFATIPAPVQAQLAPWVFVLDVALTPQRRLAQADVGQVRQQLAERGFFVQFPPSPLTASRHADE